MVLVSFSSDFVCFSDTWIRAAKKVQILIYNTGTKVKE